MGPHPPKDTTSVVNTRSKTAAEKEKGAISADFQGTNEGTPTQEEAGQRAEPSDLHEYNEELESD